MSQLRLAILAGGTVAHEDAIEPLGYPARQGLAAPWSEAGCVALAGQGRRFGRGRTQRESVARGAVGGRSPRGHGSRLKKQQEIGFTRLFPSFIVVDLTWEVRFLYFWEDPSQDDEAREADVLAALL